MKISELLKDKSVCIKRICFTRTVFKQVHGGFFRGMVNKKVEEPWTGYAIEKHRNIIFEIVRPERGVLKYSLFINGKEQVVDEETAGSIYGDVFDLYSQKEAEKERIRKEKQVIEAEKQKALLEQKKQVYYTMLQESLHQK
jgi:hypothetical protein